MTVQWYRDNRDWWEPLKAAAATAHQVVGSQDAE